MIAEPMKRLGKFTFADALDAKFNSKGIKIAAGLSTLAVSLFYLIPQMVGAGALVTPLLGLPHWAGVTLVGGVVIAIVTTAGMVSTTWVQFIKGGLLVVFSTILVGCVLWRGLPGSPAEFDEDRTAGGYGPLVGPIDPYEENIDVYPPPPPGTEFKFFETAAERQSWEPAERTGDWATPGSIFNLEGATSSQ